MDTGLNDGMTSLNEKHMELIGILAFIWLFYFKFSISIESIMQPNEIKKTLCINDRYLYTLKNSYPVETEVKSLFSPLSAALQSESRARLLPQAAESSLGPSASAPTLP